MPPSTRHRTVEWLRPGPRAETGEPERRLDGAWRVWERLRAFDRRYAIWVDVVLAGGLFLLCTGWVVRTAGPRGDLWFAFGLIAPLVLRRRAPMAVFLTVSAVALAQWFVTGPQLADAALLVALYTVAVECEWLLVLAATVILQAGIVMATVRWTPTGNDVKSLVFLTGLSLTALLTGVVVRALGSQLEWLTERAGRLEVERDQQASLAAAAERARIAREMHDVVSHNIQVMVTLADAASAAQSSDPARAAETMHEVSSTGRQALTDMRRMLGLLREEPVAPAARPGSNGGRGALAPQPGLGDLDALVSRVSGTGLAVTVEQAGRPFALSGAAGLTVYRIVQEALTNALKHAHEPAAVRVTLEFSDPDLSVRVRDDGQILVGAAGNGDNGGDGHGVAGMAERAAAFGGTLRAGPQDSGGWEVVATLHDCRAPVPV